MSVAQAQRQIDSREYSEWLAYDRFDPIGLDRGDWQAALIASTVANSVRAKGDRPSRVEDFVFKFAGDREPETSAANIERMEQQMTAFARQHNAATEGK